ncbi:hypothetical protein QUQ54_004707 [Escherichia coli]|nr:hypothetical protein [Escherichia coli]
MKYLAFIIGALYAATANGTELYKYVPESITVTANYEYYDGTVPIRESIEKPVSQEIAYVTLPFNITPAKPNPTTLKTSRQQSVPGGIVEAIGKKMTLTHRVQISNTSYITATMNSPFTDEKDAQTEVIGDLIYPTAPGQIQEVRVQCPVPDYVMGGRGLTWYWVTSNITIYAQSNEIGGPGNLSSAIICKYQFRVVPEIKLSFKYDNMTLTGVSGDSLIQSNQIIAKGYGGESVRARLSIANPNPNDISVSFSATDFNQTTQTVLPTDQGAPTDFYVKVNNTNPGSREYRVNFTAQFE